MGNLDSANFMCLYWKDRCYLKFKVLNVKIGCGTLISRMLKANWRESATIGILMNTKGLVDLIVLNIGFNIGLFNTKVKFSICLLNLSGIYNFSPPCNNNSIYD